MTSPWQDPRTGIYKLRKRIPSRFVGVAGIKGGVLKLSTGTKDPAELKRVWPGVLKRYADLEADWARKLSAVSLTPELAADIATLWEISGKPVDRGGMTGDLFAVSSDLHAADPRRAAARQQRLAYHAEEAVRLADLTVNPATMPLLLRAMLGPVTSAYLRADYPPNSEMIRVLDALAPRPEAKPCTLPHRAVSLRSLFTSYKVVASVKPRTLVETHYAVENLITFLGHDDAARIERADLARWRDAMKAEGRTNNTFNNRLSLVGQVLAWGVSEEGLPTNVATDALRLRKNKTAVRLPYSDEQAARILNAARLESRPSLRWAHWVMAFTGARAGEVLQLTRDDICLDGSTWYIAIHEETAGHTVKSGQRRHVPIHPALVAEGFLAYAKSIPAGRPLFPDKSLDQHGHRGGRSWNALGPWVRETVGLRDPKLAPSHSWRHRVVDELRTAEVEESYRDAIVGHARKTTGRLYGQRGEALKKLARLLARIPVPPGVEPLS